MMNVCQHKKLLRFGAAIDRMSPGQQRLLNKSGQTLAFQIRRRNGNSLKKREPGCDRPGNKV